MRFVVVVALLASGGTPGATPAVAQSLTTIVTFSCGTPPVTASPCSVPPGGQINVSGTGFSTESFVTVSLLDANTGAQVASFPSFLQFGAWGPNSFTLPPTVGVGTYQVRAIDTQQRGATAINLLTVANTTITISGFANCGDFTLFGATVELFSGMGLVATTISNSDAFYSFTVAPGTYTVRVTKGQDTCGALVPNDGQILSVPIDLHNHSWPRAFRLDTLSTPNTPVAISEHLFKLDQSAWFKYKVQPGGKVVLTLTGLPANYDLTLYKDIATAFNALNSPKDLTKLQAEFAPDSFSPDSFSPDSFSPDSFSPDSFSPDSFSPDSFSPDSFSPDSFSPDSFSPDSFSPDSFSPDSFSPDKPTPDSFSPDSFSGGETVSPAAFASAQTRSLLAVSAHNGTASEGIRKFIWDNTGDFYVRVRGRNGAFSLAAPFRLEVTQLAGVCGSVQPIVGPATLQVPAGGFHSIFLTDSSRLAGSAADKAALLGPTGLLATLAAQPEIAGVVVDVGLDTQVAAARLQADNFPQCPVAKNFVADRIKTLIDAARAPTNPIEYVVLVGNDGVIPYFRSPDQAGLANEKDYVPPVIDATASQASLKLGYVLSQDRYGSSVFVSRGDHTLPLADLAVGRLVENASDISQVVNAYLLGTTNGVVPTPTSALATGYDFFATGAGSIRDQLSAGLGAGATVDSLISPPQPVWTATDLRTQLLDTRHDIVFLGAHFSQATALASDYTTRIFATDVLSAAADLTNVVIFSEGCHSGYNTVDGELIPGVTIAPDFAQAFARRGATLIAGSGYQYGDTDFTEYGVRLYLEFSKQLRTGSGPISVGKALVAAKKTYLANTPQMRGIHEKTLLESTLFGLPQLRVDMPGARLTPATPTSIPATPLTADPGLRLNLASTDLTVLPNLTPKSKTLRDVSNNSTLTVKWLSGPNDATVTNPAEPALPLELRDVSGTVNGTATVLRGVGLRAGSFSDTPGVQPLTGAAATEVSTPHGKFSAGAFYPVRPWSVNYFDALAGGATRLAVTPVQYLTDLLNPTFNIQRQFSKMVFRLFYSNNIATFGANVPGLAAAPGINRVTAVPSANGTSVDFAVKVGGDPSAGIQQVWVTYTATNGPFANQWQSLDLQQLRPFTATNPSTLWRASLPLPNGQAAGDIRYIAQAVNGVGLVTLDTNLGAYFIPGADTVAPGSPKQSSGLVLNTAPASGTYREAVFVKATLTCNGCKGPVSLANRPLTFGIGSERHLAVTGPDGSATVTMPLLQTPDQYAVEVSFDETPDLLGASATAPLTINKAPTQLTFGATPFVVKLTDQSASQRPLRDQTVFFTLSGLGGSLSSPAITDFAGRAVLTNVQLPPGTYTVTAEFLGTLNLATSVGTQTLNLASDQFLPAKLISSTLSLTGAGPSCDLTALISGPPTQLQVTVRDTSSGLLTIIPTLLDNATLNTPSFSIGSTDPVVVTATKIDQSLRAHVALRVINVAGNFTDCDPVIITLGQAPGVSKKVTVHNVAQTEGLLTIVNGKPGVTQLQVTVNGKRVEVRRLVDGEKRTVNLSDFLRGKNNTITLEALGKPGGTVTVMISDSPGVSAPVRRLAPPRTGTNQNQSGEQETGDHQIWELGD